MPDPIEAARDRRLDVALLAVALAAVGAVCWKFFDYGYDDAYITYRYAKNIVSGHGFVYNVEHNFLGTTTPLYTLILAALGYLVDIPRASAVLTTVSLLGCIVLVEAIGRRAEVRFAGSTAAVFLAACLPIYRVWGTETIFVYFLLVPLGYGLHGAGKTRWSAFVLGLAILARMDAAVFTGLLFGAQAIRERRVPVVEGLILAATLAPWFAYSWLTFGVPFPSTMWAKIAQGESGGWPLFFDGFVREFGRMTEYAPGWRRLFLPLALAGLYRIVIRERVFAIFVASSALFVVAYELVLGVSYSIWYLANLWVSNALLLGAGVRQVFAWIQTLADRVPGAHTTRWRRTTATMVLAAPLVLILGAYEAENVRKVVAFDTWGPRRQIYTRLGRWLEANTPVEATVAYYEIGFLGYFSERTILDPVGLVTPGGLDEIRRGNLWWIFDVYEPDYYIHSTSLRRSGPLARPGFHQRYEAIHRIHEPGYSSDLIVYRLRSHGD